MGRGRERIVQCAACGRQVRRDKAVFIEKAVFSNPVDRKDADPSEAYSRAFFREFAYCPGCGKHLRVYEKKKQMNERMRERERERNFFQPRARSGMHSSRTGGYKEPAPQQAPAEPTPTEPAPSEQQVS
jgi:ribosomal protein S26